MLATTTQSGSRSNGELATREVIELNRWQRSKAYYPYPSWNTMDSAASGDLITKANLTTSADGWFQAVSPSFLQLIGRPIEALVGLNLIDLVHPHDAAEARRLISEVAAGSSVATAKFRVFVAGDRWVDADVSARGVGDSRVIVDLDAYVGSPAVSPAPAPPNPASPNPVSPAAVSPNPVSPSPVSPAAVSPNPVSPNPVSPAAVSPAPVSPAPATPAPATPNPVSPSSAAPAGGSSLTAGAIPEAVLPATATDPHQLYVASIAGQDVPEQRDAQRHRAGGDQVPMIEIDQQGRTTFVSGPWDSLRQEDDAAGDISERVLQTTGQVDAIAMAMGRALEHAEPSTIEVALEGIGQRWVHVLPIPSPHLAGVAHALVAISSDPQVAPPSSATTLADLAPDSVNRAPAVAVAPAVAPPVTHVATPNAVTPTAASLDAVSTTVAEAPPAPVPPEAAQPAAVLAIPKTRWRDRAADRLEPVVGWARGRQLSLNEIGVALGVLLVALVLRVWDLDAVPTGFHGDEAITGQEAQRILDQGSIGVYTGSALGQPTAPFYLHAIGVALFGNTIWATRIVAAFAGVAAVGLTYLVVQKRFDHRTAIASALGMALMTWTIHFSRIAFGVAWWPFIVLAAIAAIDRATKEMTGRTWFIAGGLATFGLYVYNSHSSFALAVLGFMAVWLVAKRSSLDFSNLKVLVWGPIGAFVIGLPMLMFAMDEKNQFFNHFNLVSRRGTDEWRQLGFFGKVQFFIGRYIDSWDALLVNPVGDGADAAGVIRQVPWIFTVLAIIGLVTVFRKYRTPFTGLLITTLIALPVVPAMTFNAETRRDYGMAPCVAILAGIGAITFLDFAQERFKLRNRNAATGALIAVVLLTSVIPYFTTFRNHPSQKWVFAEELTATVQAVEEAQQDGPVFVNWYSGRHYFDYPTLDYLLEGVPGVDRTPVHEGYNENPPLELTADIDRDQVYVFIGDYGNNLEQLQAMYPQGELIYDQPNPRVVVYEVPR